MFRPNSSKKQDIKQDIRISVLKWIKINEDYLAIHKKILIVHMGAIGAKEAIGAKVAKVAKGAKNEFNR